MGLQGTQALIKLWWRVKCSTFMKCGTFLLLNWGEFKETGGLGCLSLLLCTQEDPDLIESIASQNVDSGCIGITQGLFEMRISRLSGSEF